MPRRPLLPQGSRQISARLRILRARPSRQERVQPSSRRSLPSQAQTNSIQPKRSYRKAFGLRAIGAFEGFVDGPFRCPADKNDDDDVELFVFMHGTDRSTLGK